MKKLTESQKAKVIRYAKSLQSKKLNEDIDVYKVSQQMRDLSYMDTSSILEGLREEYGYGDVDDNTSEAKLRREVGKNISKAISILKKLALTKK